MKINDLLNLINPLTNGNNQFAIQLDQVNNLNGKSYYHSLINQNVQGSYGIYAICDPNNANILYIGKGGTVQNNGAFKAQNLNGRLKAPRGKFNNSFEYFKDVMNKNNYEKLIFLVIYSNLNNPPAYIESISLHQYLNQNNCLPMFNNEF